MILTNSQKKAVNRLFQAFKNSEIDNEKIIYFKAPTGAGKTFMSSELISQIFAHEMSYGNDKCIFVIATVSSAQLPKQFALKLDSYKKFHEFNDYEVEHISSPTSSSKYKGEDIKEFNLKPRKVFVFGLSSFNKKSLFFQNKTLDTFLNNAESQKYKIFYIRDEAHIGDKKNLDDETEKFDQKMQKAADFVIKMTATPKENIKLIELKLEDLSQDGQYLLKDQIVYTNLKDEKTEAEIIDDSIEKFVQIKKEYEKLLNNQIINPAMLVQVVNRPQSDALKAKLFDDTIDLLEQKLRQAGLKWLKYIDNPQVFNVKCPATLEYASKLDSEIDVIIFKVGPATGWDIPRACMLLQLRNVSSDNLNIQTVGRIMRNPYPGLVKNSITNKYYLWSSYQKPSREQVFYNLKKKFDTKEFYFGEIQKNQGAFKEDFKKYCQQVLDYLDSKEFQSIIKKQRHEIYYRNEEINYGSAYVLRPIENYLFLKIYNYKQEKELNDKYYVKHFYEKLAKIASLNKINFEIAKYFFFGIKDKLQKYKNLHSKWLTNYQSYNLKKTLAKKDYSIWKDNKEKLKDSDVSEMEYYGYQLIFDNSKSNQNIQYFDSKPEYQFFLELQKEFTIWNKQNNHQFSISFLAKMPTFGSEIYFEYYSEETGTIQKSYMDFAIELNDKIIMVEVKSLENDYNQNKTWELSNAYKNYMKARGDEKIELVIFRYGDQNPSEFWYYKNQEMHRELDFDQAFNDIFLSKTTNLN